MAKVPKIKKKAVSIKSRAARRQASPSIDIDKSLKDAKPPTDDKGDSVWSTAHLTTEQASNADSKPTTKKPLRRQQRLRHEKGMERASAVAERTENKITKSKRRSKIIKARAATWDDLNEAIGAVQPKNVKKPKITPQTARLVLEMDMDMPDGNDEKDSGGRGISPDPRAALVFADGTTAADIEPLDEIV